METNSNTHIRLFSLTRCFLNMDFSNKHLRGNVWGKHFKFLGHLMDRSRLPTQFDGKTVIRNEIHRKEVRALETKNWEEIDYCLLSGADYEALAFMTQYQLLSVSTTKGVLMKKGNLLQNQPLLRQVFKPRGCPVMSAFAIWYILADIYCWHKRVSTFRNDVKNYRTAVISAVA